MEKGWLKPILEQVATLAEGKDTDFSFGENVRTDADRYQENIYACYQRATDADIASGATWYSRACDIAAEIGSGRVSMAAGVIAAFSPQMSWKKNVEMAATCIRTNRFTGHYGANNRKARKIYKGQEPLSVLGGQKTRAFYLGIVTRGATDAVCIDRHAGAIALGRELTEKERKSINGKRYERYAAAYVAVAKRVGLRATELQAVTWVTWRREKGIVD